MREAGVGIAAQMQVCIEHRAAPVGCRLGVSVDRSYRRDGFQKGASLHSGI
jgi:hypothetical protein